MVMSAGTMGVCLSPCSLPGAGPMFQLGPREMELGMGIYHMLLSSANRLIFTSHEKFSCLYFMRYDTLSVSVYADVLGDYLSD